MAETLAKLTDALYVDNKPLSSTDLLQKLQSDDSIRSGLEAFCSILCHGVQERNGKLGLQSWNDVQIQAICSTSYAILHASRSLSVEEVDRLIIAVGKQSIEFALCYLEKIVLVDDDLCIQNMVSLLERALIDEVDGVHDMIQMCSSSNLVDLLPVVADQSGNVFNFCTKCCFEDGKSCSKKKKTTDRFLMTLASECILPNKLGSGLSGSTSQKDKNKIVFLLQHWAVTHGGFIPRLYFLCHELISIRDLSGEKMIETNYQKRLSFTLRVLNLLEDLTKDALYVEYDESLLRAVASFTNTVSSLFKLKCESVNCHAAAEGDLETIILMVLEEFLRTVGVIFCNSSVPKNIQTCIVASLIESLDSSIWRYETTSNLKIPVAYFPRIILYMFRLIHELHKQRHEVVDWTNFDEELMSSITDSSPESLVCHVHQEAVPILRRYTFEELLKLIFPLSNNWVGNLMNLALFLNSEGLKLRPKLDRSCSGSAKHGCFPEVENVVSHEDEALFGDLFSEGVRSVGSADGCDQPSSSGISSTSHSSILIQAASEILNFLKMCIFSPDWNHSVLRDACKNLRGEHIDFSLSLLYFQGSSSEDRVPDTCASLHEDRKTGHVDELCFDLLQNLLLHHALTDSVEDYLLAKILHVQNGVFTYNDRILSLLCQTLFCRLGSAGSLLRINIYQAYVTFIVEKAKSICLSCPSMKDILATLPSLFHIEIVLMAFHLSDTAEKATLANLILSTLREIDAPLPDSSSTLLSCWALVVSRLILILRHMIFYQQSCPAPLLLDIRTKLREAPHSQPGLPSNASCYFSSWTLTALRSVMYQQIEEVPDTRHLMNQLVDISASSVSFCRDDMAVDGLNLNWDDIYVAFSQILGCWKGKKASVVEDHIVERYIYILCWDIPFINNASDHLLPLWSNPDTLEMSNMLHFFFSSHSFLGNNEVIAKCSNVSDVIFSILQCLNTVNTKEDVEKLGWEFIRGGMWLSIVLTFVKIGMSQYSVENRLPGAGQSHIETSTNHDYITVAARFIASLIESGQVTFLMSLLSVQLERFVNVHQNAFLAIFGKNDNGAGFSLLLLIKHSQLKNCLHDELLERSGINSCDMDYVLQILSKLDSALARMAPGILSRSAWEFLLHGFPFHLSAHSATYLSCILSTRGIISVLDGLLRIEDATKKFQLDNEFCQKTFDTVMTIKNDRIFESIHGECESICRRLSEKLGGSDYANLNLIKHLEGFLKQMNSGGVSDASIHEVIVCKVVDILTILMKDPSKSVIFQYYLGLEDLHRKNNDHFWLLRGDLLVLVDSLDTCYSDFVNVRVFNFFVDLLSGEVYPDLVKMIQRKFLDMDLTYLSKWVEKRLLGCESDASDGVNNVKGNSGSLRESTENFVTSLVSSQSTESKELLHHFFEAVLLSLDAAFFRCDTSVAKSYFHFLVQLSRGESTLRLLLERTVTLIEKLAGDDRLLPGLKYLLGFVENVLSDCMSGKGMPQKTAGKCLSGNAIGIGPMSIKPDGSKKESETYVLSANQTEGAASLECDAMSVDEDEEDGTSDGEVVSVDKDEEEDSNSERALALKVCTFTSSGSNFMEQHWYFCYTCDLTVSKGCCSVCAKVCHRGHRVVYSRSSRFFCDCGAGGVRGMSCQCLKPREFNGAINAPAHGTNALQSFLPFSGDADQLPDSDSEFEEDFNTDAENSLRLSIPEELKGDIPLLLKELDIESLVVGVCSSLLPSIVSRKDSHHSTDKKIVLGENKVLSYGDNILQLKKAYKSGSLDLKIKVDYSNSKELKSHLASGSIVKSLLGVSTRGRLAVGEGDKVAIFDVGQLIVQATIGPMTADKTNVKPLSKNIIRFEIVQLVFNPVSENYLVVAGYEDCQVLTLSTRGEVTDRLAIELALQGAYIRRVDWVPGSQVQLMVVTNKFVKIYDLSLDNISPMHYFTLPDDMIVDATLHMVSQERILLLVLSESGNLFKLELSIKGNVGATPLKEIIRIQGKEIHSKGSSLHFSLIYKLLFISYQDGSTVIGRLSSDGTSLVDVSSIYEEQEGKLQPAGLHHWKELLTGTGLFTCLSSPKSNSALVVSMGEHELLAQSMRHAVGSTSPIVGIIAYKPLSKDKINCLVLHDDGSLHIHSYTPLGVDTGVNATVEKVKKLGSGILNNKTYAGPNPEFPLDFFEKTVCITADVKLGGDAIRNGDSEGAKQSLASEDGFLESPSPAGFKISVFNSNPDIVMVGFRVHVGNVSANHIPSEISIFHRVIKLDEGMRSWYDVPFTVTESLLADEEFTLSVGSSGNGSLLPRIDSLEVYGRAKDEFGWKEKMDAVLDMETRVPGGNSALAGAGKKRHSMQCASVQEQVMADGLKLLSKFFSSCRSNGYSKLEEISIDLDKLKCKQLLETIFESDRETLLQSAACRILQALFPKREMYYQVKDTMRLVGVTKSTSTLLSMFGVGGNAGNWIIEEFTSQMKSVCKIALQRRFNFAAFLEKNGSKVVETLMQVLWGIIDFEQPDTQTINNIVISSVELIYCYAECLALHGKHKEEHLVAPAVVLLKRLLFYPNEAVQTASSLAISSRLLQVPFPKQTILATDDSVENIATVPTDRSGGNNQVMIEEDSITSSVQYCCDGCSTVPILRRRWHCTICPDFDLCEACFEVLGADRLPPPHSRDHPMTAIPIDVESVAGDGTGYHFTPDDVSDPSSLPVPVDANLHNSSPSIHVLEPNESGDFSSVSDPVSISASKRVVNSLILAELLEQLKGWMETTSGIRAIPVMQLFYRLSSAVGGPFIDSSKSETTDLEKLIKWFLNEVNLSKPFTAKSRTPFGEAAILVFMFFTLMLRNWHQPGSDGSIPKQSAHAVAHDKNIALSMSSPVKPSTDDQEKNDFASKLLRACDSLRQQSFVNYLMDILQQQVNVFKSPNVNYENSHGLNPGHGCGALLTVRRDLPAGNFSPFFSDSYAKAHRADLFADYHRLLLENTFRLVYTLVRPEKHEKTGEKEKVYKMAYGKDLKLDGYQDVFCSYINNPNTTFVRRYARRLFLHLCGSKSHYYSVRDYWQFSSEMKKLLKHVNKSGGLQTTIPYERCVKIVKCLSTMAEVATARPRNWQKYCLRHTDILPFMMNAIFYFGEESVVQILKLLDLAFYTGKDAHASQKTESGDAVANSCKSGNHAQESKKKKKGEDVNDSGSEKTYLDMETVTYIITEKDSDALMQFIDCFLLEWNSSTIRAEAKSVLCGIWHHTKQSFKETILTSLLQKVSFLPMYGQNVVEYTELVTLLLGKSSDSNSKQQVIDLVDHCITPDVVRCIFETLHSQNELVANHPNSRIYNTLSSLVEFDGYYLESEPCVACSSPEVPYSRMKLESLKSETKFTDNRIIVKCTGSYTIQSVTMNVHDARKSKSVKVLNLYYNNRPVADLSELKNNWSLWKRAKSCHLAFNQTELKVEFPIPITACNFMIELDSFYENLQALSLEPLQCPRCSRPVTDRHGICSNCHENAYQCRQCRNINYENLDSFLCNECGFSKYGRFEFNFMAKPSFTFDNMENDEDMKRGLAAIESESENAHRRYQQLLGFKKPLLKIVSSIGENDMDSQQKDSVQQMMVSLPGPSCKINRKIALLGVLYGEKCKAAFDSVSKSVQTLQGLRKVLMNYLHQKHFDNGAVPSRLVVSRTPNNCYGCATIFVTQCLELLQVLAKHQNLKKQLVSAGILSELFENNIHQGPKNARVQARAVLCTFSEGDINAVSELNNLIQRKVMYCLEHHRSMDIAVATREELLLLTEVCSLADEFWESRLRVVFQLLFSSIKLGAKHPAISEHVILPCLRIISQACTPPKSDTSEKELGAQKSGPVSHMKDESNLTSGSITSVVSGSKPISETSEKSWDASPRTYNMELLSYLEWEKGASYLDFVRRQYKVTQAVKNAGQRSRSQRHDYLSLKYGLRWKRRACKTAKSNFPAFELGSWVKELILSACSQSIRSEMCMLINLLCSQSSSRQFRLLNLLVSMLPATLSAGESAAEYFELLFKMIDSEDARLCLTVRGCVITICKLITQEVSNVESLERSLHIDISQGFILHKLIELLGKFLEVQNIRSRFMRDDLVSEILEALIVIRGLIVQKTKVISDCNRLLKDLLDSLLMESSENKRQFIRACINGLQVHGQERKGRTCLFILEQLCNLICPSKPEPVYLLVLNKAHTQEEFIRGSMNKNPYSSAEIGPLMRDVKNKICHQLELLGLLEDDYSMELLVAGNIISLDLSIAQVYEQVWKKSNQCLNSVTNSSLLVSNSTINSTRDCPPMTVTYRLQGLDGEATEPMIKELEEDRGETQDPEVEFSIAGAVREFGGLEIILGMIQHLRDDFKSNQEQLVAVLNLLMHCCKIRENRQALLRLGALGLLLETARRAFSVDAIEAAEGILLIVESLTLEANESDNISITVGVLTVTNEESGTGEQAKKIVLMFLERLSQPLSLKKSNKQQRNTEMVARILPYLTYGEPAAMEALIQHFSPYLQDWGAFDCLQKQHLDNPKDETIAQQFVKQKFTLENFVRVSESLKTSSCGERLKDIILERGITGNAIRHLRDSFGNSGQTGFRNSAEWIVGLKLPSVPLILSMLLGLSMGHFATQKSIDEEGILPLLHALEGVPGENDIGTRAENLLDMLSNKEGKGDGFLEDKVLKLRHATKDEMRRKALRKREELLQGLGMRQEFKSDGGERIVVAHPVLEGLDDVKEEENGLACMVCREGYSLRPTDLLGVYSYSKRVNLGVGTSGSARGECVYTTVSYFNIIHFQCHQEAKRADSSLKNPKKEWEGAALRNNESLCNSLFPVRGPSVPLSQYIRHVDQYWENLNGPGRADGSRLRLLTYDIVLMLARFATGASFSTDSRGGGRESNSIFLPFMIQMARHLIDQGSPSQRRNMAKAVSSYVASSMSDPKTSCPSVSQSTLGTEETVQFMMVNSLLSESYESWVQHRCSFLQRGIYHAYMQHTHARSSTRSSSTSLALEKVEIGSSSKHLSSETGVTDDLLSVIRPMLVYTGLIEQLQRFFKGKKSESSVSAKESPSVADGEDDRGTLEGWEVVMNERLLNVKELTGFSKVLLTRLDDMNSASDLQKAFDVIGIFTDVLSGDFTRCEDFVHSAINMAKS